MADIVNASLSRPGFPEGGSYTTDAFDLFLELFGGEVLTAFNRKTVTMGRHFVKNIEHGKSASFPASWRVESNIHLPGEEIAYDSVEHGERVITIDSLLVAPVFIDIVDEAMVHWDARAEYVNKISEGLAVKYDQNVLRTMVLAARETTETIATYSPEGLVLGTSAGGEVSTDPAILLGGLFAGCTSFDENDVPDVGRQLFIRPAQYHLLVRDAATEGAISSGLGQMRIMNSEWSGGGSIQTGNLPRVNDVEIVKTNNVPSIDDGATAGIDAKYQFDYSDCVAVLNNPAAVGTVKLLDMALEGEYDMDRQGHKFVGKYAVGHGILRPECSIEFTDAAAASGI